MTKKQREKAELLMLKATLENNPNLKKFIQAMLDNSNPEIKDVVTPVIEEKLKEARMIGVLIGWNGFALRALDNIKEMKDIELVRNYLKKEVEKTEKKLNIKLNKNL